MAIIQGLSVELLECVLLHLSMHDLLLLQRVCKIWREVIQNSPQLQREIFLGFVPSNFSTPDELSRFVYDNSRCATKLRESQKHGDKKTYQSNPSSEVTDKKFMASFNPVFPSEGDILRTKTKHFRESLDSQNSWLDMFLTQPPTNCAEATVFYKRLSSKYFRWPRVSEDIATVMVKVCRTEGVRARDVLQEVHNAKLGKMKHWQRIDIRVPGVARE